MRLFNNLSQRGFLSILLILFAILTIFSMFFGFSYDESNFASRAALYYYYDFNPLYYLQMGSYFIPFLMGGYFPTVVLSIFGLHNAISIEAGVKLPMDLAVLVGSLIIYRIIGTRYPDNNSDKTAARSIALLYMINPVTVFFIFFQGNELSITIMFLLATIYLYIRGKPVYASAVLAVASTLYLFPFFLFVPLLLLTSRKFGRRLSVISILIFLVVAIVGLFPELVVVHFYAIASEGTIISGSSGPISLSTAAFAPSVWSLYFIPYTLLNIKAPYLLYQVVFGLLMLIPATYMAYFFSKNNYSEVIQLAMPLTYICLGFAMLSPTADPQYIFAAIPFLLILWFYNRSELLLILYLIASFLSIVLILMVSPYTLGQYYMDVYPQATSLIIISTPGWAHKVAYASYFIVSLATIVLLLFRMNADGKVLRNKWRKLKPGNLVTASLLFAVTFMVFSAGIISPGISHVPQELAFNEKTQYQYSPHISKELASSYSYLNFTTSPDLKLLSSSILNETSVGLYFSATPVLHSLGYYGSNATYMFNSTTSYFVSYNIPYSSQVTANLLFVNQSYRFAKITVFSGCSGNMGKDDGTVSADSGNISFFNYIGKNIVYLDSLSIGNLTNGTYTMVVSSDNGAQGSIAGWANTTDLHGFKEFGFISANSSTSKVHVMKSGYLGVLDYRYSGVFSFSVSGHNISANISESNGNYVAKIPASLSTYVLNLKINSSFFSEFKNPIVIFLFPFPEDGRLALANVTAFLFGMASFIAMVSFVFVAIRKLYRF